MEDEKDIRMVQQLVVIMVHWEYLMVLREKY